MIEPSATFSRQLLDQLRGRRAKQTPSLSPRQAEQRAEAAERARAEAERQRVEREGAA